MNSPPLRSTSLVRFEPTPKGLALTVLAVGLTWVALKLAPVVLVLVVSLVLVGTLNPAVDWLATKRVSRGWGIGMVFGALVLVTGGLFAITLPSLFAQVSELVKQEPALRNHVADFLARSKATASLSESLRHVEYGALAQSWAGLAFGYSSRFAETVAYLASAVFLSLYIMIDRDRLRGGVFALVPRTHHIRLSRVILNLETIVGGYVRGQALTSLLMAVFAGTLLAVCGVKNALALAVIAGVADVLPYLGVFLSIGPALVGAAPLGLTVVIIVLIAMLAYEELESRVLVPKIYGNVLRLPSSVVLFALLTGGTLLGITGALLALPTAAAIQMLIKELRVALPGEEDMDESLRARDQVEEAEYERRVDGMPAEQAAAVAVEISEERHAEEAHDQDPPSEKV